MRDGGRHGVLALLVAACAAAVTGCGSDEAEPATVTQCEALRDHTIALRLPQAGDDAARRAELDKHTRNLRRVLGDGFIEECQKEHTRASADCALEATSLSAVERCRTAD